MIGLVVSQASYRHRRVKSYIGCSFILQSDYDFSNPEWKKYIKDILSKHMARVRPKEWMLRHIPDFYELYCYKD